VDLISLASHAIWPECQSSCMVWADGQCVPSLSNQTALPGLVVSKKGDATVLELSGGQEPPALLQIVSASSAASSTRRIIRVRAGVRGEIVHTIIGNGSMQEVMEIILEDHAQLKIGCQVIGSDLLDWRGDACSVIGRNARLSVFCYSQGAGFLERKWQTILQGEGSEAVLKGIDCLDGKGQARTMLRVEHRSPESRSQQHFKTILDGSGSACCEGFVHIARQARSCCALLLCQNILLSQGAKAEARPVLEVLADDAKARHGATFSQLGDEELFYFLSRGIAGDAAKRLWLQGFCREIYETAEIPAFRKRLYESMA
jgi:Fe-S cluster assembly protein SufD